MTELLLAVDPEQVKPGWTGLLVTLAMAVALALLLVSFTHRLKKIDVNREQGPDLERIDEPGPAVPRGDEGPPRSL